MANNTFLGYDDEGNSQYGYTSGNSIYVTSKYAPGDAPPDAYGPFVQGAQTPTPTPTESLNIVGTASGAVMPGLQAAAPTAPSPVDSLNITGFAPPPNPAVMPGLEVSGPAQAPSPSPVGGLAAVAPVAEAAPTTTQAGTSILGPSATRVGNTLYTSDGQMITNPIASDYEKYGLEVPKGTPTAASRNPFDINRRTAQPATAAQPAGMGILGGYGTTTNPYAAFGTGQDTSKAYLSQSGSIVLPDGRIVQNPTQADYAQYGIGLSKAFGKGAYTQEEQGVYRNILSAGSDAANILRDSLIANGVDKNTANQMADTVRKDYTSRANEYRGQAFLPGAQSYKDFYSMSPSDFLGNLPEEQRSFRPSAEQVFNSLSPEGRTQRGINTVDDAQKILDANPDFKVNLTPEMVQSLADNGKINLGTKFVGIDYDSLKTTDPNQLKAINEATNKFNLGLNLMNDWGLMSGSKNGRVSTGVPVSVAAAIAQGLADGTVSKEELQTLMPSMKKDDARRWAEFANDMSVLRGDTNISLSDLQAVTPKGTPPKLIDPQNNIYQITSGNEKKDKKYIFAQKVGDDQYKIVGGSSLHWSTGGGGFWNYLPVIASIGLSFVPGLQGLGGTIGQALTGAASVGIPEAVLGNAILGAGKAALTGGDVGMGALTGGVGGGVGQYLSGVDLAGLPLKVPVVGGLANMAAGTVGNLMTGQPIQPGLIGGLTGIGAGVISPEVSQAVGSALPSGTPNIVNQALTGGLLGAGIGSITGQNPAVLGTMGAVNPLVNYAVGQTGLTGVPAQMASGALRGAAQVGLTGGDMGFGVGAGAIAPAVSYGFDQFGRYVGLDKFGRPVGR